MATQAYLCVHGHFYQPPRENPWLGMIERQPGAAPRHDWNERVSAECYELNTVARVYDGQGQVIRAVNNFEWMSFNIGATLLRWLEKHRPLTYRLILEADRRSVVNNEGHGNAIAQVYNHMIMPLANRRDQVTQVRWGLADFQARFGRAAEAMWLPETACDPATLDVLSAAGLRYAILAPHQAQEIRRLGDGPWQDVSGGGIDPTRAYRYCITPYRTPSASTGCWRGPPRSPTACRPPASPRASTRN
jgi:alpha-amylase/alpha-mannosidase (GH57 family)